jgi:hypothetical protein
MIIVLVCTCLLVWTLAVVRRRAAARPTLTQPVATAKRRTDRVLSTGPEDELSRMPAAAVRDEWTELDDRQLIRLLTDSAS